MVSGFQPDLVHSVRLVGSSPETVYKHSHFKSFRIHTCRQLRVLAEIDRYLPSVTPLNSTLTKTTPANFSRMNTYEKRGRGARVSGFVLANPELQGFQGLYLQTLSCKSSKTERTPVSTRQKSRYNPHDFLGAFR